MQFDPGNLSSRPDVTHAAEAAKRKLIHSLATEAMTIVPQMRELDPLIGMLSACAKTGYGWGSNGAGGGKGTGAGAVSGAEAAPEAARSAGAEAGAGAGAVTGRLIGVVAGQEVPLAEKVIQRMHALAGTKYRMRYATILAPGLGIDADKHVRLWEAVAACPPSAQPLCEPLLHASALVLQIPRRYPVPPLWPFRMLLALLRLQHLLRRPRRFQLALAQCALHAGAVENRELCHTVAALGKLLLANEAVFRPSISRRTRAALVLVAQSVLDIVQHVQRRLQPHLAERTEEGQRAGLRQHVDMMTIVAAVTHSHATPGQRRHVNSSFDGWEACQLHQGLTMIGEVFGRYVNSVSNGGRYGTGGLLEDAQLVALHAIEAAELAACQLLNGGLEELTAQELSGAALALARSGHGGTSDSYRALAAAAAAARGSFRSAATPADWARLWHALALAKHRPGDALVQSTAAGLAKQQQQYGDATAEDCATLLRSLAEVRCYEGGLVEGLLGRLVQLVAAGGGAVEVRDLVDSVWAVAVRGRGGRRPHRGAWGRLRGGVGGGGGRGGGGVGNQEQLRQLWQVQLDLDGLVGLDESGGISSSSSSSSSPGHMRHILPPDLLRAAEQAAGEGPGGVYGASRRLQCLREEVCSVLQGMVQQAGGQQTGQGTPGQQRAGRKQMAPVDGRTASRMAAEEDSVAGVVAARRVPSCTIVSVTPEAAVTELRCTADAVVELGGGRRVVVEVEGPGRLLTNHPHTETRTGPAELLRRQLERVLGSGNVVGVSYWAWEELRGDRGRQEVWLAARLAEGQAAGGEGGGEVNGRKTQQRQPRKQEGEGVQAEAEEQQGTQGPGEEGGAGERVAKRRGRPQKAAA